MRDVKEVVAKLEIAAQNDAEIFTGEEAKALLAELKGLAECKTTYDLNLRTLANNHRIQLNEETQEKRLLRAEIARLTEERDMFRFELGNAKREHARELLTLRAELATEREAFEWGRDRNMQLHMDLKTARAKAFEEAAVVCDRLESGIFTDDYEGDEKSHRECAAQGAKIIRALAAKEQGSEPPAKCPYCADPLLSTLQKQGCSTCGGTGKR